MIVRNIINYFKKQREKAAVMHTIDEMQHNYYQACHGDFAFYPDAVYSPVHEEEETVPEIKNDRRRGQTRLVYEG